MIYGTNDPDVLQGMGTEPVTMIGRAGDDRYLIRHPDDRVLEQPGEGTDEIVTAVSYTLPPHVENLRVEAASLESPDGGRPRLVGNELANRINGAPFTYAEIYGMDGDDVLESGIRAGAYLDGGNGDDRLFNSIGESRGGAGADTFVAIGRGAHTPPDIPMTVLDFRPSEGDRIEILAGQAYDTQALFDGGYLRFEPENERLVFTLDPAAYETNPNAVEQIVRLPGLRVFEPSWVRVLAR